MGHRVVFSYTHAATISSFLRFFRGVGASIRLLITIVDGTVSLLRDPEILYKPCMNAFFPSCPLYLSAPLCVFLPPIPALPRPLSFPIIHGFVRK